MADGTDVFGLYIFVIILLISLPFIIFGIVWTIVTPLMFLYGVLFSESNMRKRMDSVVQREAASIEHFGKDPLSTLRGLNIISGISESGLFTPVSFTLRATGSCSSPG